MCTASSTDTACVLLCPTPEGLATPLGESYVSVAHQMLAEVREVAPITVGAGNQPATFKPYLSALIKVCAGKGGGGGIDWDRSRDSGRGERDKLLLCWWGRLTIETRPIIQFAGYAVT